MSKPSTTAARLRWATAPLLPGDVTEPDTTHKDEGWQDTEEPPHSFFNYWQNLAYLWLTYLEHLEAEALTWTAAHIFNAIVTFNAAVTFTASAAFTGGLTASNASGPAISAQGTGSNPAIVGTSGTGANSFGMAGFGASASGKGGLFGQGGTSTSGGIGGIGKWSVGGDGNGSGSSGGAASYGTGGKAGASGGGSGGHGAHYFGGDVNGATNTSASAGVGGEFVGGTITSDANHRKGGVGLRTSGGVGQNGIGNALECLGGNVVIEDGNMILTGDFQITAGDLAIDAGDFFLTGTISQSGGVTNNLIRTKINGSFEATQASQFDDDLSVTGALTVADSGSSIAAPGAVSVPYGTNWANAGGGFAGLRVWKDAFGVKHLEGNVKNVTDDTTLVGTVPGGFEPVAAVFLILRVVNAGGSGYTDQEIVIATDGTINANGFDHTAVGTIPFWNISYR